MNKLRHVAPFTDDPHDLSTTHPFADHADDLPQPPACRVRYVPPFHDPLKWTPIFRSTPPSYL